MFFLADASLVCNDVGTLGPAARAAATACATATVASVSASETALERELGVLGLEREGGLD